MIDGEANKGEWLLSNQACTLGYNLSNLQVFLQTYSGSSALTRTSTSESESGFYPHIKLVINVMSLYPYINQTNKGRQDKRNVLLQPGLSGILDC